MGLFAGILLSLVIHFVGIPLLMWFLALLDLLRPASFEPLPPPAEVEVGRSTNRSLRSSSPSRARTGAEVVEPEPS
ncbi:MAG: hypothetical protein H6723_08800 [Sandaracinus sp.]|nr:hypothetical protein [Sandaracinus sp.]